MIEIFGTPQCSFCVSAKDYCDRAGFEYVYKDLMMDEDAFDDLNSRGSFRGVPQIFVDGKHIGGYTELLKLDL